MELEMIKLKDILNEAIPKLPRINMGFGEAQDYSKMMIKKSEVVFNESIAAESLWLIRFSSGPMSDCFTNGSGK